MGEALLLNETTQSAGISYIEAIMITALSPRNEVESLARKGGDVQIWGAQECEPCADESPLQKGVRSPAGEAQSITVRGTMPQQSRRKYMKPSSRITKEPLRGNPCPLEK